MRQSLIITTAVLSLSAGMAHHAYAQTAGLPYSIDFKESCEGWTVVDNNGDRYIWRTDFLSTYGVYMEGSYAPHNDDFISPQFALSKDKTYDISTVLEVLLPSGEDVVTLMGGTDKTAMTEIARLTVTAQGPNRDETEFTPESDGEYCFAFRNTTGRYSSLPTQLLAACRFAIAERAASTEGALVSTDFSGENPLDGWTVLDANNDGHTWGLTEGLDGIVYNSESAASSSDWLISPLMRLEEGQDYIVEYTLAQGGAFVADKIDVRLGTGASADAMTSVLADEILEFPNGNGQKSASQRITGIAGGMYCIGFRAATAEPNGTVRLLGVHVTPADKTVPAAVTSLTATSDSEARTVTLTWTNPDRDTAGAPIQTVDILIYENGTPVGTLTGRTAGADDSYTYSPAVFAGTTDYTVTAAINGAESEAATTSVCLDDIQGEKVLVKTINISSASFPAWTVIDNNGNGASKSGKWVYDMGLYFKHPLGKPTAEDDWAISPSFDLQPDKRYVFGYSMATHASGPATFDVTVGDGQTIESQTRVIQTQKGLEQNGFARFETKQFDVDAEGKYYFGFHVTDVAHSITVSEISVYSIKPKQDGADGIIGSGCTAIAYDRSTSILTVDGDVETLTVCDAAGRVIAQTAAASVDMTACANGLYIARATDRLGNVTCAKFVK